MKKEWKKWMANEKEKRSKGGINQQRNKKVTKEAKDQWKKPKIMEKNKDHGKEAKDHWRRQGSNQQKKQEND